MLTSILSFLLVITIIVFIHEMGHYLAARSVGVRILEFSIGFGKALFKLKDKHGTTWKICPIPLGGYVKMYGDAGVASNADFEKLKQLPEQERKQTFSMQPPLNKAYIAAAGPFANFFLAFVIFFSFSLFSGRYYIPNKVASVQQNSPAEKAGIKIDDKIIEIDGTETNSFDKIYNKVSLYPNTILSIKIERKGITHNMKIKTAEKQVKDKNGKIAGRVGVLGIASKEPELQNLGILDALYYAIDDVSSIISTTYHALLQMVSGARSLDELRGTITIADHSGTTLTQGLFSFIFFIAMISINIGFVNLLPIPLLDGGHILFAFYELIIGKPPSEEVLSVVHKIGMAIIIFMFVISTSNDIKALLF